jgi:hypothetical protein
VRGQAEESRRLRIDNSNESLNSLAFCFISSNATVRALRQTSELFQEASARFSLFFLVVLLASRRRLPASLTFETATECAHEIQLTDNKPGPKQVREEEVGEEKKNE